AGSAIGFAPNQQRSPGWRGIKAGSPCREACGAAEVATPAAARKFPQAAFRRGLFIFPTVGRPLLNGVLTQSKAVRRTHVYQQRVGIGVGHWVSTKMGHSHIFHCPNCRRRSAARDSAALYGGLAEAAAHFGGAARRTSRPRA